MDDLELARILRAARDRSAPPPTSTGSRAFMGRVTTTAPAVGKFMLVQPQSVLGTETEGGSATITDLGSTPTPVYLVGPGVPATGDQVIARWSDWRWVARKRGTGGSGPPTIDPGAGCFCRSVASVLYLSVPAHSGIPDYNTTLTWNVTLGQWVSTCDYTPYIADCAGLGRCYRQVKLTCTDPASCAFRLDYSSITTGACTGGSAFNGSTTYTGTCSPFALSSTSGPASTITS
jgi:hypothetical protein